MMMKKIIGYLSLIAIPAIAQTPSLQWERSVNGQYSNYDYAHYTWKDPSGNLLIVGNTGNDAFLMKVDNNGNQLMNIIYDGPQNGSDAAYAVRSDAAGNIYMGGMTDNGSYQVPFVAKFNSSGVKQWEYIQSNATMAGVLTAMALDNYSSAANVYFTGNKNDSSAIVRLNANTGAPVWEKTLWPHGKMNDIDMDNNGHPLVCGYQAFSGVDADLYAAVLDINTGYPLRGYWHDGFAADSVTDAINRFDIGTKIKAGPAGTFAILGTIYDNAGEAAVYIAKFGSTGNAPTWEYKYESPNHLRGSAVQLITDASFSNFYYLAGAFSTTGLYSFYTIAGKVNNSGTAVWEKEFSVSGTSLQGTDLAVDANGNAHFIADQGFPADIYYKKLSSASGATMGSLQYDNLRGGGNAYDLSSNITLDITGHPYIIGSSNASTYTYLDVVLCRLNTNATLDWDITYDLFGNSPDDVFNVQVAPWFTGGDEIVTCGEVVNNITGLDVSITSYDETGNTLWQETFDDNNGGDHVIGFERSASDNFFMCTQNYSNNSISITEFYRDGTTNFTTKPSWSLPFSPVCFKIDSAENSFVAGSVFGYSDFYLAIYMRNSTTISGVPAVASSVQTVPASIATDNTFEYVAGYIYDGNFGGDRQHIYVQKFDQAGTRLWSAKIMGLDSSAGPKAHKIVFDRASSALYVLATATSVGSTVDRAVVAKIDLNGNVIWMRSENLGDTRTEEMQDITVKNGKIYITGYANLVSAPNDNFLLAESWDVNGNKQWEYTYDNTGTDEEGTVLAIDNAGNIFIAGKANGTLFSATSSDFLTVKLNPSGNLIWSRAHDGAGNGDDQAVSIALSNNYAANQRVYVAGNTQSNEGLYHDIGTIKYCDLPATTVSYSGSTSICQSSSITLAAAGTSSGNIVWSPGGQTGGAIVASTSGAYYFTYTEADGCSENSDTVNINIKGAPVPVQICMVTVDDSSKHNLVIWDKTSATPDVIGFNVYRESLPNVYSWIGSVPMSSLSEFSDPTGDPNVTTYRYKISAVDSCGNESVKSNYHNTIFITSNGSGTFNWNTYNVENSITPVDSFFLMRDDLSNGVWHAIGTTVGNQQVLSDPNFATFQPTASWRVETKWSIQCTPTARMGSGNTTQTTVIKSKSNITNNRVAGMGSLNEKNVVAYPNPAQNILTVNFPASSKTSVFLTDLLGETVYSGVSADDKTQIDISKLAAGTYLLSVSSEGGKFVKRIVKE